MENKRIILIIMLIVIAGAGFVFKYGNPLETFTGSSVNTADWKSYRNEQLGFELKYPQNWTLTTEATHPHTEEGEEEHSLEEEVAEGALLTLKFYETETGIREENCYFSVHRLPANFDAEEWIEDKRPRDPTDISGISKIEDAMLGNLPAKRAVGFGFDHSDSLVVAKNGKYVYSVIFEDSGGSDAESKANDKVYNAILASFTSLH
jgi:hypothetical protein